MNDTLQFHNLSFNALTAQNAFDLLKLRQDVFILEQTCLYPDIDGYDTDSQHILAYQGNQLIGYARILPAGVRYSLPSFGRFCILESERNKGYAHALIQYLLKEMADLKSDIKIQAQVYLSNFYAAYGFEPISEAYDEDGIPHVDMVKQYVPEK